MSASQSNRSRRALLAVWVALLAVPACRKDSKQEGGAAPGSSSGSSPSAREPKEPSARTTLRTYRPLLSEAGRADVDAGGVLVDLGTVDQHKYVRGGWGTGWSAPKTSREGTSYASVPGRVAALDVLPMSGPVTEIALRARSRAKGQRMAVLVDGKEVGSGDVPDTWGVVRIRVPAPIAPGSHELRLLFNNKTAAGGARADIDWLWMATTAGAPEPLLVPRVMPVRLGESVRRALPAPSHRSYVFYLQPPAGGQLVFDYGADKARRFVVRAQADGEEPRELFAAQAEPGQWREARVDLSPYAGRGIRLELAAEGEPSLAAWGEPEIMLEARAMPAARAAGAPDGAAGAPRRPKNVVVILIDTQRADSFSAINPDSKIKTPSFDALALKSTLFPAAYANENWTKPSVATLLSGLYPVTHTTKLDASALPAEVDILPQAFKKAGFKTAGFIANGYVSDKFGFDKGWDVYKNYIRESRPSEAEHVYADAIEWVTARKAEPFFLYLQTIDPHVQYRVGQEYSSLYYEGTYKGPVGATVSAETQVAISKGKLKASEDDLAWIRALYSGEVTYHDEHMGKFFDQLEALGVWEDTLVVITNDHGEELGDHQKFGHGHSLYDELVRAPMLLHFPPLFPATRIEDPVENVDIAPTLVEVMGLEPMKGLEGVSLVPLVHGRPTARPVYAVTEFLDTKRSLRVGRYKLHRSIGAGVMLFDVVDDPGETKDLAKSHPIARRLADTLMGEFNVTPTKRDRLKDSASRRKIRATKANIDPETRKQLEALGYFGE